MHMYGPVLTCLLYGQAPVITYSTFHLNYTDSDRDGQFTAETLT